MMIRTFGAGLRGDGPGISVDETDWPVVSQHVWSISTKRGSLTKYAHSRIGGRIIYLHRLIMGAADGQVVDHIDGDGLNNTRDNLRICSQGENIRSAYSLPGRYTKPKKDRVLNTVKARLADGTVKTYVYDRVSGKRVS